jgi:hypothetical protein
MISQFQNGSQRVYTFLLLIQYILILVAPTEIKDKDRDLRKKMETLITQLGPDIEKMTALARSALEQTPRDIPPYITAFMKEKRPVYDEIGEVLNEISKFCFLFYSQRC